MFPIVNTDELEPNKDFTLLNQRFLYFTLGFSQKFDIKKRSYFFRGSFSPTIYSFGEKNTENGKNYTGNKFILFLSTSLSKHWGVQVFYKRHSFSGAGTLNIDRYGLGINYSF